MKEIPMEVSDPRESAIARADRLAALGVGPIYVFDNGVEVWTASQNTRSLWNDLTPIYVARAERS